MNNTITQPIPHWGDLGRTSATIAFFDGLKHTPGGSALYDRLVGCRCCLDVGHRPSGPFERYALHVASSQDTDTNASFIKTQLACIGQFGCFGLIQNQSKLSFHLEEGDLIPLKAQ